jgi:ATP-dependent protease Clp ATPase subunit
MTPLATDEAQLALALGTPTVSTDCKPRGVIGQHIATQVVAMAVSEHYHPTNNPTKPLVMMLYGAPGVGKTFMETTLRKDLFVGTDHDGNGADAGQHRFFC